MARKRIENVDIVQNNSQSQHSTRAPLLETINALSVDSDPESSDTEPIKHMTIHDDILDDDEEDEEFERMLQQSAAQPSDHEQNKPLTKHSSTDPKKGAMRFLMECRSRRPLEQSAENVLDSADNSWNNIPSSAQSNNKRSVRFNSDVQITSVGIASTSQANKQYHPSSIVEQQTVVETMPAHEHKPKQEVKIKERLNFFERIRDNISSTRESKKNKKDTKDQQQQSAAAAAVAAVHPSAPTTAPSNCSHNSGKDTGGQNPAQNTTVKSKSILKDPLCEKLRSEISTGQFALSSFSQLENEIDALLCGEKKNKQICDITTKHRQRSRNINATSSAFFKQNLASNKLDTQILKHSKQLSVNLFNDSELALTAKSTNNNNNNNNSNKAKALKRCSINARTAHNEQLPSLLQSNQYLYQFRPGSPSLLDSIANSVPRIHVQGPPSSDQFLSSIREEIQTPQVIESSHFFEPTNNAQLEYSLFADPVTGPSINRLMEHLSRNYARGQETEDCLSVSTRSVPENHIYEEILYECLEMNTNTVHQTVPQNRKLEKTNPKNSSNFNPFIAGTSQQDTFQNHSSSTLI